MIGNTYCGIDTVKRQCNKVGKMGNLLRYNETTLNLNATFY